MSRDHPTDPDLLAYVAGRMTGSPFDEIESHLEECTHCANKIATLPVLEDYGLCGSPAYGRRRVRRGTVRGRTGCRKLSRF